MSLKSPPKRSDTHNLLHFNLSLMTAQEKYLDAELRRGHKTRSTRKQEYQKDKKIRVH
jgi:hypothetical protein